ncbi:MAG TPA: hypothetical protein VH475_00820 [Tepidisphaeraceae bacterium]|jgi:type II secretory pathway pseudopilin PulG
MDTMTGLVVAGILGVILVIAITRAGRAQDRLEEQGTAVRICQHVMDALHQGRPAPSTWGEAKVTVTPVADRGAAVVAGQAWVEVGVSYRGRTASLVGLVPQGGGR